MTRPGRPARIVFAVNSDTGQINIHLAVIHALLQRHRGEVEVHLLTHAPGQKRCPPVIRFHEIPGLSNAAAASRYLSFRNTAETSGKPTIGVPAGFLSMLNTIPIFSQVVCPYEPSEYISTARAVEAELEDIQPDLVVLDNVILPQAVDATRKLKLPYIFLSPNTWSNNATTEQGLRVFTWPIVGTGWAYPMALYLIPLNIFLQIYLGLTLAFAQHLRAIAAARRQADYVGQWLTTGGETRLCMGVPDLDYYGHRPPILLPIGPMLLPSPPLIDVDPDLDAWIRSRQDQPVFTIMFSLGSHVKMDPEQAESTLRVFEALLLQRGEVRIYAKIMRSGEYDLPLLDQLEKRFGKDRLRVVQWKDSDPVVLLRTGKVDLAIHHGGSNSYHEALSLGIPQIALASWLDCYEVAARVESLGLGKWGNKKACPYLSTSELLDAVTSILDSYPSYKATAVRCAGIAARSGESITAHDGSKLDVPQRQDGMGLEGREVAAEWIFRKARSFGDRSSGGRA